MNNRTLSYFSLFLFFFSFCFAARGQVAHVVPSARSVAQTAVADDASWNAFHNPAMLGYIRPVDLSVAYENRYLLKELSTKSIQAGFATPYVNVGASFSHFGYSLYHDMLMGIDVARDFGGKFALGLGFDYYMAYVAATGRYQGALLGRIGLSLRLVDRLVIGFSTFNPFQNNLRMELTTKRLPSVYSLGTADLTACQVRAMLLGYKRIGDFPQLRLDQRTHQAGDRMLALLAHHPFLTADRFNGTFARGVKRFYLHTGGNLERVADTLTLIDKDLWDKYFTPVPGQYMSAKDYADALRAVSDEYEGRR